MFEEVKKILNKDIVQDINQFTGTVDLKEDNPAGKVKRVEISGLHKDTIVFKLDYKKFNKKSPYLSNQEKGIHAGCDYVIVTRFNEKDLILFFELKSSIKGCAAQLRNSIPFIDYMASLLRIHYDFDFNFKRHFIAVTRKRQNKKRIYQRKGTDKYPPFKFEDIEIKEFANISKINLAKILENYLR